MLELRFERNQIYHQADGPAIHLYMRHRWHLRGLPPGPRIVHLADNMDEHAHGDTNAVRSVVYRAQDLRHVCGRILGVHARTLQHACAESVNHHTVRTCNATTLETQLSCRETETTTTLAFNFAIQCGKYMYVEKP